MRTRTIIARAPVRVCDVGGWTDTWFAKHGFVCSVAINRCVTITIETQPSLHTSYVFDIRNYNQICSLAEVADAHPLLAAALNEIPIPNGYAYTITIDADMPPGSSTGTSASVSVALLAALAACNNTHYSPAELARRAHRLETVHLGLQSGVQDQCGAAFGGANLIEIPAYPETIVTPIPAHQHWVTAFNQQHLLYYYGQPHQSSAIHQQVIARITQEQTRIDALEPLRIAAQTAASALRNGNLRDFASALIHNTEAQAKLHPELISQTAQHIISIAQQHDAWGWKVNGAGGDGGSISLIASDDTVMRQRMMNRLAETLPHILYIESAYSSDGVRVAINTA